MNIETGSGRIAAVAAVVIFIATVLSLNSLKGLIAGLALAFVGYGLVYLACIWILKGFTKEEMVTRKNSE